MEKKLSSEEVLKKHFQWEWAITISQESKILSAMEEYASQLKGEAVSDAVEWISVEDRLPDEGGRYWCYIKELNDLGFSYFQWNCNYNEREKRFSDSTLTNGENVTHWMPLPKPPKTSNNE